MKYFTKLDVRAGYNNIRIKKGDEWKAAFITPRGLFEPTVMFFGLCNSPATFQAFMDGIFQIEIINNEILVYMDDILIFAKTLEELEQKTRNVLRKLSANDLYLKPDKCQFAATEIEYVGLIIKENHIAMDPVKIAGIVDWPTPTKVKDVQSFTGFTNYYRRFIHNYATITKPLDHLKRKNHPWLWTHECEKTFQTLKKLFTTKPLLLMPDKTKPFFSSKQTHQNSLREEFYDNLTRMATFDHADIFPKHSTRQNKIMTSTTANSSPFTAPSLPGDTTS